MHMTQLPYIAGGTVTKPQDANWQNGSLTPGWFGTVKVFASSSYNLDER